MSAFALIAPESGAHFSLCKRYRYRLWRRWALGKSVLFIMLNPSTATEIDDDPTIRRCIDFAKRWRFGRLDVCNAFAFRSTDPRALSAAIDPIGPANQQHVFHAASEAQMVIAAWGASVPRTYSWWPAQLIGSLGREIHCLGQTANGSPRHPLYLAKTTMPVPFELASHSGI